MKGRRRRDLEQRLERYQNNTIRRICRKVREEGEWAKKRWTGFAAAGAASLAVPSAASAAIHYAAASPEVVLDVDSPLGQNVRLDSDNDFDLAIGAGHYGPDSFRLVFGLASGAGSAVVVGSNQTDFNLNPDLNPIAVRRFSSGELISPFGAVGGKILHTSLAAYDVGRTSHGQWGISDTGFAGILLNGSNAGWIKIRTRPAGTRLDKVELLEWAYEDVPGMAIAAGAGSPNAAPLPGDYNGNGSVGPEDLNAWRTQFGRRVNPAGSGADGNQDGRVNAADYVVWQNNAAAGSGSKLSANSAHLPEPSAVTLGTLALGAAGIAALRRRKEAD